MIKVQEYLPLFLKAKHFRVKMMKTFFELAKAQILMTKYFFKTLVHKFQGFQGFDISKKLFRR